MKRTKSEIKEKEQLDASPKRRRTSKSAVVEEDKAEGSGAEDAPVSPAKSKARGSADDRASHIRDVVKPFPLRDEFDYLKVISWNVNGLNALVSSKKHVLDQLIDNHAPDVMFLQETKIQEPMEGDYADLVPGYHAIFSSSTVKKGYSGTCVLLKKARLGLSSLMSDGASTPADTTVQAKKKPQQKKLSAFFGAPAPSSKEATADGALKTEAPQNTLTDVIRVDRHLPDPADSTRNVCDGEGRIMTVELADCFLVGVYVPNSGEGLKRLDYRLNEWDPKFREYLCQLNARKPVILTGDLNVGHLDLDIHNPTAKHIAKQAGLTPEERQSFTAFVTGPFRDAFRHFYPDARGQFTYWSQRTFARPVNKGIRLDYFVVSQALLPPAVGGSDEGDVPTDEEKEAHRAVVDVSSWLQKAAADKKSLVGVYDSYILHEDTRGCSDHCPVVLCLAFR